MDVTITTSRSGGERIVGFELPAGTLYEDVVEALKELEIMAEGGEAGPMPNPYHPPEVLAVFGNPFRVHVMLFPGAPRAQAVAFAQAFADLFSNGSATISHKRLSAARMQAWWARVETGPA